jgi:hypothetical protein
LQTLALVAEVIHGTPSRFSDPARFSFSLGGKDGHPFPVPLKTYDESIEVLQRSLNHAQVDSSFKKDGLARLYSFVKAIENQAEPRADFQSALDHERQIAPSLNGRTVVDNPRPRQLPLF